jgi:hypothetical protein
VFILGQPWQAEQPEAQPPFFRPIIIPAITAPITRLKDVLMRQ